MRPLLLAVALAWVLVVADAVTGTGVLHSLATVPTSAGALAALLGGWVAMTLAMMGPATLPAARHVAVSTRHPHRTVTGFALAYLLVWLALGALGAVVLGGLVTVLPGALAPLVGPAVAVAVVPCAALAAAAGWQLSRAKHAALADCRLGVFLPATGRRADRAAAGLGARHGLACVTSCWSLMTVMLVAPGGHLAWMLALTGLIHAEKARGLGPRLARPSAAVAAGLALAVLAAAVWFPGEVVVPEAPAHHHP